MNTVHHQFVVPSPAHDDDDAAARRRALKAERERVRRALLRQDRVEDARRRAAKAERERERRARLRENEEEAAAHRAAHAERERARRARMRDAAAAGERAAAGTARKRPIDMCTPGSAAVPKKAKRTKRTTLDVDEEEALAAERRALKAARERARRASLRDNREETARRRAAYAERERERRARICEDPERAAQFRANHAMRQRERRARILSDGCESTTAAEHRFKDAERKRLHRSCALNSIDSEIDRQHVEHVTFFEEAIVQIPHDCELDDSESGVTMQILPVNFIEMNPVVKYSHIRPDDTALSDYNVVAEIQEVETNVIVKPECSVPSNYNVNAGCRLCFITSPKGQLLFSLDPSADSRESVEEIPYDSLPKSICINCQSELYKVDAFRMRFNQPDAASHHLQQQIDEVNVYSAKDLADLFQKGDSAAIDLPISNRASDVFGNSNVKTEPL